MLVTGLSAPPALAQETHTVTGTVRGPDTRPVVGALVEVETYSYESAIPQARTAADGTYSLTVPRHWADVVVRAPESDRTLASAEDSFYGDPEGDPETVLDFTLQPAAVYGQVTGPGGPLPSRPELSIDSDDANGDAVDDPVGSDGWYAFAGEPGTYRVTAGATYDDLQHLHPVTASVTTGGTPARLDLVLRTGNVSGRVLDPHGEPVQDALVSGTGSDDAESADVTDEDGFYTLDLPAGQINLEASAPELPDLHPGTRTETIGATATDVDITLLASNLTGTVRDAAGEPLPGASLRLDDLTDTAAGQRSESAREEGRFSLRLVAGHRYRLSATAGSSTPSVPSYATSTEVLVPADGVEDVTVQLRSADQLPYAGSRVSERAADEVVAGDERSEEAVLSADGSTAVFTSYASNLHTSATERTTPHIYAKDLATGALELLDVNPKGAPGSRPQVGSGADPSPGPTPEPSGSPTGSTRLPAFAGNPDVSDDGRYVTFTSTADDLVTGDTNGHADVFVRDRQLGITERISVTAAGSQLSSGATNPTISGDGRIVAFESTAGATGQDGTRPSVWVVDTATRAVRVVVAGGQGYNVSNPALDADGSTLGYLEPDPDGTALRVLELPGAAATAVGVVAGRFSANDSFSNEDGLRRLLSLSASGHRVAYADTSTHLAHVLDLSALPSGDAVEVPVAGTFARDVLDVRSVALSPDGTFLALSGKRSDSDLGQLYAQDLTRGINELVTVGATGEGIEGYGFEYYTGANAGGVSADKRRILASIGADGVLPGDTNGYGDVFVFRPNVADAAPAFADGATLRTGAVGSTVAELTWSPASDDVAVTGYRIVTGNGADQRVLGTFGGGVTTGTVTGLSALSAYTVSVVALDAAGHATAGPSVAFTTTEPPADGEAVLTGEGRADGVALAWEAKPGASAYKVLRRGAGPATPEEIATVPGTSYLDRAVAAETAYRYQVLAVLDGTATAHTRETAVATPALAAPVVTFAAPQLRAGTAKLGANLTVTAVADPRRTLTANVTVTGTDGNSAARSLEMTEGPAGTYTATTPLAEGTAVVTAIAVTATDGAGHSAAGQALNLPLAVSGALSVELNTPDGALAPAKLTVYSPSARSGASFPDPAATLRAEVLPADDYEVVAYDETGRVLSRTAGIGVGAGRSTAVELAPAYAAELALTVTADGVGTVEGASVTVTDAASKSPLAGGTTAGDGTLLLRGDLLAGREVVVRAEVPGALRTQRVVTRTLTLARGRSTTSLTAPALAQGAVAGVLRDEDGAPISGARISLGQRLDGRTFDATATTDDAGAYRLSGPAGPGTLVAGVRVGSLTEQVTVPDGGTLERDLVFTATRGYSLDLKVFTQLPGGPVVGPQNLSPSVAGQYRLRVTTSSTQLASDRVDGNLVYVRGRPGETYSVCGRMVVGTQQLPERCVTGTFGEASRLDATDLLLSAPGVLSAEVRDADGEAFRGPWTATAHRDSADSPAVATVSGEGSQLRLSVPEEDGYVVVVRSGELSGSTSGPVTSERVAGLAPVLLQRTGAFSTADSRVFTTASEAVAGAFVPVRTTLRNASTGATRSTRVLLQVPLGTELAAGSITRDGESVTTSEVEGGRVLALGTLAPGASTVLTYRLQLSTAYAAPQLVIGARVSYEDASGARAESLTPAALGAAAVSLSVPRDVSRRTVNAAGRGPAGASIEVRTGVSTVGTAVVGPGGFWRTQVELPGTAPEQTYLLRAETTLDGARLISPPETVRLDTNASEITEIAISQVAGAKGYTFDPRAGLARFPVVFVPNKPVYVTTTFSDPDKVTGVVAHIGDDTADAARRADGRYLATFDRSAGRGDIWIDHTPLPTPGDINRVPSEDEVRNGLPQSIADFTGATGGQPVADPDDPDVERSTVRVDLPGIGKGESAEYTVEVQRNAGRYQLTEADRARANATGLLVYDLRVEVGADGNEHLSFRIPNRMLAPADPAAPAGDGGGGGRIPGASAFSAAFTGAGARAAVGALGLPLPRFPQQKLLSNLEVLDGPLQQEETSRILLDGTKSYLDTTVAPYQAANNSNYADLASLYPLLNGCNEEIAGPYKRRIDSLLRLQLASDGISVGLSVVGLVTAPVGGLVISAVGGVVGLALSYDFLQRFANLKLEMEHLDCSERTEANGGYGPRGSGGGGAAQASPYWLHDPSGYLFEAVPGNRVEGVTATLVYAPAADGPWTLWNADFFGQTNPQRSTAEGRYGWDVPEGFYQVLYEKAGYETARSRVLEVLPPHFDVNIAMTALRGPGALELGELDADTLVLTFDQYMDAATVTGEALTLTLGGTPTTVVPVPVDPQVVDGRTLARSFTLELASAPAAGTLARVSVAPTARNYSGRTADATLVEQATLTGARTEVEPTAPPSTPGPSTPPSPPPAAGGGGDQPGPVSPTPSTPTPTPTVPPAPGTPQVAPTLKAPAATPIANRGASVLTGTARPGAVVTLRAYVRPSTSYRVLRTTTADAAGTFRFTVFPQGNMRAYVTADGADSASVVQLVAGAVTLRTERTAKRTVAFSGTLSPALAGQGVNIHVRDGSRLVWVATAEVASDGTYRVSHTFLAGGRSYPAYAAVGNTVNSAPGRSATVRISTVR